MFTQKYQQMICITGSGITLVMNEHATRWRQGHGSRDAC